MCPLDKESLEHGVWYPSEEICNIQGFSTKYPWILRQRKIARKVRNKDTYFTHVMLNRSFRITAALEGLDPDKENTTEQLSRWYKKHPAIVPLTNGQKQALRERFKKRTLRRKIKH
jgi:hypothetical protein